MLTPFHPMHEKIRCVQRIKASSAASQKHVAVYQDHRCNLSAAPGCARYTLSINNHQKEIVMLGKKQQPCIFVMSKFKFCSCKLALRYIRAAAFHLVFCQSVLFSETCHTVLLLKPYRQRNARGVRRRASASSRPTPGRRWTGLTWCFR